MGGNLAEEKSIKRCAAIDIGTNTVLLLVADISGDTLNPVYEAQLIPRLGKGVDASRNIAPDAVQRVADAVNQHLEDIEQQFESMPVTITATSAVRDARNRQEVLDQLYHQTGYKIRLLSGDDEAHLTFKGALTMVDHYDENAVVLDIGGGSTEIIAGVPDDIKFARSLDIGCVRFSERYLPSLPADEQAIYDCAMAVRNTIAENNIRFSGFGSQFIGVAGTVTSLAAIFQELEGYDAKLINNVQLSSSQIEAFARKVLSMNVREIEQLNPAVMKGRADIFPAGLLILTEVMRYGYFRMLKVSTGGLRHGVLMESNAHQANESIAT